MKKLLSVIFSAIFAAASVAIPVSAADVAAEDYKIVSPYQNVVWSGDGAWKAYKGNLHTHSTVSDADTDLNDMIIDHYNQGYDFLAMTDHAVTGKRWDEEPTHIPLYLYQYIIGNKTTKLTKEQYEGITTGTYPDESGNARGYGMTCVTNGNELNGLTLTKCHVNGMFLPDTIGDNYLGYENDHEGAVKLTEKAGGISFINHPGDWLRSGRSESIVSEPDNVHYFSDILLRYNSCLGMEVFNERNHVTRYDRILWDNILMECLPYGKNVIGFSNNDAHYHAHVDSSFSVFMMEDNTVNNIKKTMKNGAFFCVTRELGSSEKIGPVEGFDVRYTETPYPMFTEISVDGHKVTIKAKDCNKIQWIANGNVFASKTLEQSGDETTYVIDLDTVEGSEDFLYIRCELFGEGGLTLSQALVIDDGTAPEKYVPDTSASAKLAKVWHRITSLRIFVLIEIIIDKIMH